MLTVSYLIYYDTYQKMGQITKCDSYFITKCDKGLLQIASGVLLPNATFLSQNTTVITKCVDFITKCVGTQWNDKSN